uniref:Uncharacterized protein n=1 Tax=Physcomitrium patens TaxID=3218 RepID=A0A2K1J8G6_PHYPA|nr:hypothetical protein PHYPA_020931 [Physcomitrium patens]
MTQKKKKKGRIDYSAQLCTRLILRRTATSTIPAPSATFQTSHVRLIICAFSQAP